MCRLGGAKFLKGLEEVVDPVFLHEWGAVEALHGGVERHRSVPVSVPIFLPSPEQAVRNSSEDGPLQAWYEWRPVAQNRLVHLFLTAPRRVPARRWIFYIHLILGVALGAYFAVVAVTGAAIVFAPEFTYLTLPPAVASTAPAAAVSLDIVYERAGRPFPDRWVTRIHWSPQIDGRYRVTLKSRTDADIDIYAYVDRTTGEILGMEPRWIRWLRELHYYLLNHVPGQRVNGIGAVLLAVASLTGLVVWWLGSRNWSRGFRFNWRAGWKGLNYETHRVVGIASLGLLVVWAITGVYFAFPLESQRFIYWAAGDPPPHPPTSVVREAAARVSLDAVLAKTTAAISDGVATSIDPPTAPDGVVRVKVHVPGDYWEIGRSEIYFDQYTGELRGVHDVRDLSTGRRLAHWMMPIHFGRFGGGIFGRVITRGLWVVFGVTPAILFVTGCVMWWNRSLSKQWRRRRTLTKRSETLQLRPHTAPLD